MLANKLPPVATSLAGTNADPEIRRLGPLLTLSTAADHAATITPVFASRYCYQMSSFTQQIVANRVTMALCDAVASSVLMNGRYKCHLPPIFETVARVPSITLEAYIRRFFSCKTCSLQAIGMALLYIDELIAHNHVCISPTAVFKLFAMALTVAIKTLEDDVYNNEWMAWYAGMKSTEFFDLELNFLMLIKFGVHANWNTVATYVRALEASAVQAYIIEHAPLMKPFAC